MPTRAVVALGLILLFVACEEPFKPSNPGPEPDAGRMSVAINGAITYQATWGAFGEFRDRLGTDSNEISLLGGAVLDGPVNLDLTVVFPGKLVAGTFEMGPHVFGVLPEAPSAYVDIDTAVFVSLSGTLTVTADDYPLRPGLEHGSMHGTMTFRAARLGGPTADTITVTARFNAHWYHYLYPTVSVTLTGGGPVLGTSVQTYGQSVDDDHGGRFVSWEADLDGVSGPVFPYEVSEEFRLAAPAVGTFTLANLTPGVYTKPAQWPAAFASLFYRDDSRVALSAGGTLTVTRFVAPTDEFYGEIHGTLDAPLALWSDSTTVTSDTVQVHAAFAVQLWPLGGIPASAMARGESAPRAAPAARFLQLSPARGSARQKP